MDDIGGVGLEICAHVQAVFVGYDGNNIGLGDVNIDIGEIQGGIFSQRSPIEMLSPSHVVSYLGPKTGSAHCYVIAGLL